jgi:hypothetical protein
MASLLGASLLSAQTPAPPANDTCAGAIVVPSAIASTAPYLSPVVEVSGATVAGDPALPMDCGTNVSRSIWFRFTPSTTALYTLSVGADTETTVDDTVMAMYTSQGGCNGPFSLSACNDDSGLLHSAISTNLSASSTYYVVVWVGPITDVSATPLNVQLRVSRPITPTNDVCSGAEIIPTAAALPYLTAVTDTTLAAETGDPASSCAFGVRSVWYRFSPAAPGTYIFSTDSDTVTTVADTALTIYRNSGGCGGTFTEVVCNDSGFGRGVVSASLTNGATYYIVVWDQSFSSMPPAPAGYIAGETLVQLRVSLKMPPTVVTLGANSVTSTNAVLTSSINPNGALSRYWFEWGSTMSYGSTSAVRLLLGGTIPVTNSIPIGGYPSNTTIHYRAVATNSLGQSNGQDRTFLWSSARPQLVSATNLADGSYRFSFAGNPDQLYLVQFSTNLMTWKGLTAAFEFLAGQYQFIRGRTNALSQEFFRVALP